MDYKKRCQWCGEPFIAHKMTTIYCSKLCIDRAYKARMKKKKEKEHEKLQENAVPKVESIGDKTFLNPVEAAKLLGIGKSTMYRYLDQGIIKVFRTPAKTFIRRADIETLFENPPLYEKRNNRKFNVDSGKYSMNEIITKYNTTKRIVERYIKNFNITKIVEGRNVFYPKSEVDKYLAELTINLDFGNYYTNEDIMEKYNMTHAAVVAFARRHQIPKVTRSKVSYYSKAHVDYVKETGDKLDPDYYTYQDIEKKYGFTKDQVSYYIRTYRVERKRRGNFNLIRREDFDRILLERMNGSLSIAEINSKIEDGKEVREEKKLAEMEVPYAEDSSDEDNEIYGKVPGYICAEEIAERYKIGKQWVHYLTRTKKVPRIQKGGYLFYDEKVVDELFKKYASPGGITEWYTTDDIEKKYNMSPVARRSFTHRHNIPTKKEYGVTYYSKLHVDFARNPGTQYAEDYYMVEQIMEIYHVDRKAVYNAVKYYKIPGVKDGAFKAFLKVAVDKVFNKNLQT